MPLVWAKRRYYDALRQPVDAESFVTRLRDDLTDALTALGWELPKNKQVQILPREGGWIKVMPLDPQPEPATLAQLLPVPLPTRHGDALDFRLTSSGRRFII